MALRASDRVKARTIRLGNREVVTEELELSFWADISHRCMTASWPTFIGGAALVFISFNAVFALLYWLGDHPIANVPELCMRENRTNIPTSASAIAMPRS